MKNLIDGATAFGGGLQFPPKCKTKDEWDSIQFPFSIGASQFLSEKNIPDAEERHVAWQLALLNIAVSGTPFSAELTRDLEKLSMVGKKGKELWDELNKRYSRKNNYAEQTKSMNKLDKIERGPKDLLAAIEGLQRELYDAAAVGWKPEAQRLRIIISKQTSKEEFEKAEEKVLDAATKELSADEMNAALIKCLEKMGTRDREFEAMRSAINGSSHNNRGSDRRTTPGFSGVSTTGRRNHQHGMMPKGQQGSGDGGSSTSKPSYADAKVCMTCGGAWHQSLYDCPATNAVCQLCDKKGHYAKCCPTFTSAKKAEGERSGGGGGFIRGRGRGGRGRG